MSTTKYSLKAELRSGTGKERAKKLRVKGEFPAIVYGAGKEPAALTMNTRDTELILAKIHGEKVLVDLEYGGAQDKAFVRNIQRDPVVGKLLHVDFFRVDLKKELQMTVPVLAVGTAAGTKEGGLLETLNRQIEIRCLPENVPPHIEVNVEPLEVGQSIHVRDLPAMNGVKIVTNGDIVLFAMMAKSREEAATPAAAAATAAAPAAAAPAKGAAPAKAAAPAAAAKPAAKK